MALILLSAILSETQTRINAPPSFHYQGVMIPPGNNWVMYEPYKEFIVTRDDEPRLCRAFDIPKCTWWNAVLITSVNESVNKDPDYYHNVPWVANHMKLTKANESQCKQYCLQHKCTAFEWWRLFDACLFTMDKNITLNTSHTSLQHLESQKIPNRKPYVSKESLSATRVHDYVDMLLTTFGCKLNKFRCATD